MKVFPAMVYAELYKILTRGSGRAGLVVAALVAAGAVAGLQRLSLMSEASFNNQPLTSYLQTDAVTALSWALQARNFFVLPLILLMVSAQMLAGEWSEHTLRALLLRPVSRGSVLLAKFLAATLYAGLTLLVTAGLTGLFGAALFPTEQPFGPVLSGYAASWLSDMGLIAVGFLISALIRSVAGVVVGTVLFLMADVGLRGLFRLMTLVGVEGPAALVPFFPGNALDAWEGWSGGWDPQAFVGLAVLIVGGLSLTWLRFERADIA